MTGEEFDPPLSLPKADPGPLEFRARPRPAIRFRKGLIAGLSAIAAGLLAAVSWLALDSPRLELAEPPPARMLAARPSEILEELPDNYEQVPQLGPPLPGDLGRPILKHRMEERNSAPGEDGSGRSEEERLYSIRSAPLSVEISAPSHPAPIASSMPAGPGGQLLRDAATSETALPVLSAGTIIAASLITGLNSDVPGIVLAQVSEPVRDSVTGKRILIPQGARLVGEYDSKISYGQQRAMLVWNQLVMPDGRSIKLDKLPAQDRAGYSGLSDEVDFHGWRLLKGVALSTALSVGTGLGTGDAENVLLQALGDSAALAGARAGDEITRRNLDVKPTITVRPGWPIRIILHQDMHIASWEG